MKIINWFNPEADLVVKAMFTGFWQVGNSYEENSKDLAKHGYYVPKDQHDLVMKLLDIQVNLDIGERQVEWRSPAELEKTLCGDIRCR